jgi:hypothetical protein
MIRVAGHSFESDSLDGRCTLTHSGASERCTMTRSHLWEATESDLGKEGFAGYGSLNQGELAEIRKDEERVRNAAWNAVMGVCAR